MRDASSDAASQNETRSGTIVEAATIEASSKARMEEILRLTATDDPPNSEEVRRTTETRMDSTESSSVLNSSQPMVVVLDNDDEESSSSCRLTNENERTQTTDNQNTCSKSPTSSNVSTTEESAAFATSSSSKGRIQLILRLTAPQPSSSSTREVESTPDGAQQLQSTNNQEEGQPLDNRTAGRRRPFPFPPQQPGAVPIAGPDARTDGQHDHGTIVIGGTTVVASSSHSASQMMEPIPALLVPETTTNHNHSSLLVELVHATTIPTKMSRRTILAALFALLLVAGCAIGLALHFGKNRSTNQRKTQPEQQFTTWVRVGDEDESATRIVGTRPMDQFGSSVAISGDGSRLVAGAPWSGSSSSFVSSYSIHEDSIEPLANATIVKQPGVEEFGAGLSLSWDGTVLAVGSVPGVFVYRMLDLHSNGSFWEEYGVPIEIQGALTRTQVSANGLKLLVGGAGSVQAFRYNGDDGGSWSEYGQALQSSNDGPMDLFGWSVALSANGDHLAIGIPGRDSIYGESTGSVQVFSWNGTAQGWRQSGDEATIDGIGQYDAFGFSVALSADGSCVAIGAIQNTAFSLGIPNSLRPGYVQVYCYGEGGRDWIRRGETLAGERDSFFGYSIDLSSDGRTVAVGAPLANAEAGQVHIFRYQDDRGWVPLATFDGDPESNERCGTSVSMSSNGDVVAVGCPFRNVHGTGDMEEDLSWAGSVRVYREVLCEEEDFALCRRQGRGAFVDLSDSTFGPRQRAF